MDNKNLDKIKGENPFIVPEDYFSTLTDQIMEGLPTKSSVEESIKNQPVSLWDKVKPLAYLAAIFIGAALIVRVLINTKTEEYDYISQINVEEVSDEFIDETIEGAFLDNYDMHVYLTSYTE